MKTLKLILLILALPSVVRAQYNYGITNGQITITKYTGTNAVVSIPSTIGGLPVTGIGLQAFADNVSLVSLTIPDSVTSIGAGAFETCTFLTTVVIGNGVTSIGDQAFWNCWSLSVVEIGYGLTYIGVESFSDCYDLSAIYFYGNAPNGDLNNPFLGSNGSAVAFYLSTTSGWGTTFAGIATEVWTPFSYSVIGNTVTITGYNGLGGNIAIPSAINGLPVTTVGNGSFFANQIVTSIYIPNSVTSIGDSAFLGCTGLTSMTIPDSVATLGTQTFNDCTNLTNVTLGNGLNSIPTYAFYDCTKLPNVNIPDNVTIIASNAFDLCTSLATVTIGTGVVNIGNFAFSQCESLENVVIPPSVLIVGDYAFQNCLGLTNVTIQNGTTALGNYAFWDCIQLPSVIIPNTVTSIGTAPFRNCLSLTNIAVEPQNVSYTSSNGILFNISQTSLIQYPAGDAATSYLMPSSVTSIGSYAFAYSLALNAVYFPGNAPGADVTVFTGDSATVYYLLGAGGWTATFGGAPTAPWNTQPVISTQPTNYLTTLDGSANFGVTVLGTGPFFYEWFFDGMPLPTGSNVLGAASNVLVLSNTIVENSGNYFVVITNSFGVATSIMATLTVNQGAPVISWANPIPITYGLALSSAQLDATANVPGAFTYMPPLGSVLNVGTNILTVVFTPADTTNYTSATNTVVLTVLPPPPCDTPPSGMVAWWTGDTNAVDIFGRLNGTLMNGATNAPGLVNDAFDLPPGGYVSVPDSPVIDLTNTMTVEAWIYTLGQLGPNDTVVKKAGDNGSQAQGFALEFDGTGQVGFWVYINGVGWQGTVGGSVTSNQWVHLAGVYDGTAIRIYENGVQTNFGYLTGTIVPSPNPLNIGRDPSNTNRLFNGLIDEVSIYESVLKIKKALIFRGI